MSNELAPRWWQWLTVLSLDAPAVAVLWQWQLARAGDARLDWSRPFVLGASVWLAYAADRWIEGWRLDPDRIRTQRHRFYQRWRWPLAGVWAVVLAADIWPRRLGLDRRALIAGAFCCSVPVGLFSSHQLIHRHRRWRVPKEVCIAAAAGRGRGAAFVTAPAAALRRRWPCRFRLFVLLCLANCALISTWERSVDESHGQTSLARQFSGRLAFSHALPWCAGGGALLAAGCAAAGRRERRALRRRQQPPAGGHRPDPAPAIGRAWPGSSPTSS